MERIGRLLRWKGDAIEATTAEAPWRIARSMALGDDAFGGGGAGGNSGGRVGGSSVEEAVVTVASALALYRLAEFLAVFAMVVNAMEIEFA